MNIWILVITLCGGYGNTCNTMQTIELSSQKRCIQAGDTYVNKHKYDYDHKRFDLYCQEK